LGNLKISLAFWKTETPPGETRIIAGSENQFYHFQETG